MRSFAKAELDAATRLSLLRGFTTEQNVLFQFKCVLFVPGLGLAFWIYPHVAILLVGTIYLALNLLFSWHAQRAQAIWPNDRVAYAALVIHKGLFALLYDLIVLMLALNGGLPGQVGAMLLLCGQALYALSTRTTFLSLMLPDLVGFTICAQIVAHAFLGSFTPDERWVLTGGVTLLTIFFLFVALRTLHLNARLQRTSGLLARAHRTELVGRLTGGIAHDFNNLLTVVRGNIDLLREVPETERPALLTEIEDATKRGGELIARLSQSGHPASGRDAMVHATDAVQQAVHLARRTLPANVCIELYLNSRGLVRGAPIELEMAVLNLLTNASDALPEGGRVIVRVRDLDEGRVCLTVEDEGLGMSADTLARATEAFETTKPLGQGTGLGLAMVQGFVDQTGSTLSIRSAPGRGTMIQLVLPRVGSVLDR